MKTPSMTVLRLLFPATSLALALTIQPLHANWNIETVDTGTYNGWFPSLVLDPGGKPCVAYLHFAGGSTTTLKYAQRITGAWQKETIEEAYQTGWEPSLAFDSTGKPRVAYLAVGAYDLKYAEWNGSSWLISSPKETQNGSTYVGIGPSLAIDPSPGNFDSPVISHYIGQPHYDLYYTRRSGFNWTESPVETDQDAGRHNSLALDPATGNVRIAYRKDTGGAGDVKYVSSNGINFTFEVVDTVGDVGESVRLKIDANGTPKVCYYDRTNGALKYARRGASGWLVETVDNADNVGEGCSLALDSFGNPRISYYDRTSGNLKYAAFDGTVWHIEVVDAAGDVGNWSSIACDSSGNAMIAYTDLTTGELKFAQSVPGTTFSVSIAVTPAGYGTTSGSGFYEGGSSATIQAYPNAGYVFSTWSGSATGSQNPLSLTVNGTKNIVANFAQDTADSDSDGLTNYQESVVNGTNPVLADTDGDSLNDGDEVSAGSRPTVSDATLLSWLQSNPGKISLYNATSIQDLNLGGIMIQGSGGQVDIRLQLQDSLDLSTWNAGEIITFPRSLTPGKSFFRVRALGPQP